jgi:hypothetical protein
MRPEKWFGFLKLFIRQRHHRHVKIKRVRAARCILEKIIRATEFHDNERIRLLPLHAGKRAVQFRRLGVGQLSRLYARRDKAKNNGKEVIDTHVSTPIGHSRVTTPSHHIRAPRDYFESQRPA